MGADYYEVHEQRDRVVREGRVPLGVGPGVTIRNAIIDKNPPHWRGREDSAATPIAPTRPTTIGVCEMAS